MDPMSSDISDSMKQTPSSADIDGCDTRFSMLGNSTRKNPTSGGVNNAMMNSENIPVETTGGSLSARRLEAQNSILPFQDEKHEDQRGDVDFSSYQSSYERHFESDDASHPRFVHSNSKLNPASKKGALPKARRRRGSGTQEMTDDLTSICNQYTAASSGDLERLKIVFPSTGEDIPNTLSFTVLLVQDKSCVSVQDVDGWTPLHYATRCNQPDILELLLEAGADPLSKDSDGWTALHNCARNGQIRCLQVLIKYAGCNLQLNKLAETPLHVACRKGKAKVATILIDQAAKDRELASLLQMRDQRGATPEMVSSSDFIRDLIRKRADMLGFSSSSELVVVSAHHDKEFLLANKKTGHSTRTINSSLESNQAAIDMPKTEMQVQAVQKSTCYGSKFCTAM